MEALRVIIYCRKSTDREDRQILSTDSQKRILLKYAKDHGLVIVENYVEKQSAYKKGRPLFSKMMQQLEVGEADAILTYHLTRLARNAYDGGWIINTIHEGHLQKILTPEKQHSDSSDDQFMMQIHFAMAKKSSDDTSKFVKRDIQSKLLKGELPGMVPIGYLNIDKEGRIANKQYEPIKQQALEALGRSLSREEVDPLDGPLMKNLFEAAAKGVLTLNGIRNHAYEIGLRTRKGKKKFSKSVVQHILTNPYYYGALRYQGQLFTDNIQHEPLITKELFERVQDALERKSKGRVCKRTFSFRGILTCGECGCAVTAERQKGHVYYHCTHRKGACSQRTYVREEDLQNQLFTALLKVCLPEVFIRRGFERTREIFAKESETADAIRRKLQTQYNNAKLRLDSLFELKLSPNNVDSEMLSDEEFMQQKESIKEELQILEKQLESHNSNDTQWIDDCEVFIEAMQKLPERLSRAPLEEKREIVMLVCSNLVLKDQKVAITYHEPFATIAEFPLAGKVPQLGFERDAALVQANDPQMLELWQAR